MINDLFFDYINQWDSKVYIGAHVLDVRNYCLIIPNIREQH